MMKTPVIVACCRTALGRSHPEKGVFRHVRSDDLAVAVVRALVDRTGIDPAEIEDLVFGNTQQQREQGFNVGRLVGLIAGLPHTAGGATINRLCGSSLQAINQAAHAIAAGAEDVHIVGGLEHMQHIAMDEGARRHQSEAVSHDQQGGLAHGFHGRVPRANAVDQSRGAG